MTWKVLGPADYRRTRWKNDGGWTTELAVYRSGAGDAFDWRVSIAEIESDGPFSAFPGYDRAIALLEGVGMELRFDDAEPVRLERRLAFTRFAGETKTSGVLLAGKVRDFNVIWKRDVLRTDVLHRPLVGPMVFFRDATWFIYIADGHAEARSGERHCALHAGTSLLLHAEPEGTRVVLSGGGEVVLVKFQPTSAEDIQALR